MISLGFLSDQQVLILKVLLLLAALLAFEHVYANYYWRAFNSPPIQSFVKDLLLTVGLPLVVLLCNIPRPDPIEIGNLRLRIRLRNLPRVLEVSWRTRENASSFTTPLGKLLSFNQNLQQPGGHGAIDERTLPRHPTSSQTHGKSSLAPTILDKAIEDELEPLEPRTPTYLCLRCRQPGHHIDQCPFPSGSDNEDWSQAICVAETDSDINISASKMCFRCQELNLMEIFDHPTDFRFRIHSKRGDHARPGRYEYRDYWSNITAKTDKHSFHESDKDYFVDLGYSGSTYFQKDCAVCVLLFTLSPYCNYLDTRLLIIPDWIEHRQEPKMKVPSALASRATCLYVSAVAKSEEYVLLFSYIKIKKLRLTGSIYSVVSSCLIKHFLTLSRFSSGNTLLLTHCSDARNALCILGPQHMVKHPKVASGRRVGGQADYHLLQSWLENCDRLHDTYCRMEWSVYLHKIRLIDVVSCRIVEYPINRTVEYLALSYVWGNGRQKAFSVGSKIKNVSATIQDAIEVTRKLGKRFLWVDSVCVDQKSDDDKAEQITSMSAIYRGAYATIVALNGRCADSGLPRVDATRKRQLPSIKFPQIYCTIEGIYVGTAMPTLRQQIERSTWATRAWTYQEALLSPRCIYFTQHQVYFECNILQCCESIDDSTSAFHSMTRETLSPLSYTEPAVTLGQGVFRNPFFGYSDYSISQSTPKTQDVSQKTTDYREVVSTPRQDFRGLLGYNQLISRYSNRRMTNQLDALNAVSGILQQLQEEYYYEKGFFYGIPCADMQLALLWKFRTSRRRSEFPSWTWAGHEGQLLEAYPKDIPSESWLPTSFKMCKTEGGTMTTLSEVAVNRADDGYLEVAKDDQLLGPSLSSVGYLDEHRTVLIDTPGILLVKGIVLRLSFTEIPESPPRSSELRSMPLLTVTPCLGIPDKRYGWRRSAYFSSIYNGLVYDNCWRDEHTRNELNKHRDRMQDFLLVAREKDRNARTRHHLLLLQDHLDSGTKLYSRVAVICLELQDPKGDLHYFNPRHMWVPLA